jgi:hypothetical protein
MAALVLHHIEKGSVSFATTDVTQTVTLSRALTTDTSKTMLFCSARVASNSSIDFNILGRVLSTTQIQFERAATPGVAAVVNYEVIEFVQGISVQHLYFTQTATTTNTTISAVTLAQSFAFITHKGSGGGLGTDDMFYANLTTTTNLATVGVATQASAVVAAQVVQIDDAAVQKIGPTTWTTGTTTDITVTSITDTQTFWFFGNTFSTSPFNANAWPYLSYVNSTTLRYTRAATNANTTVLLAYVVSLTPGVAVQNILTTIASSGSTVSPTISSVNTNLTDLLVNCSYQMLGSANTADDQAGDGLITVSGLTATAFTATRAAANAVAMNANVQVLQWVTSSWFMLIEEYF